MSRPSSQPAVEIPKTLTHSRPAHSLNARFTSFERSIGAPSRPPTAEKKDEYRQNVYFYEDVIKNRIPQSQASITAYRARPGQAYEEVSFDNLDQLDHLGLPDLDLGENEKVVSPRATKLLVDMDFDVNGIGQVSWRRATRGPSEPADPVIVTPTLRSKPYRSVISSCSRWAPASGGPRR